MNYCPLNITTCYTFLSSSLKIDDIFKIAIKLGYRSFGVNDLLVMHSYGNIASLDKKYHLNPAYGVKLNVSYNEYTFPLSCYIHNEEGYRNLIALISLRKETIDNDELRDYKNGLIAVISFNDELKKLFYNDEIKFAKLLVTIESNFDDFYLGIETYSDFDQDFTDKIRKFYKSHKFKGVCFNKHLYLKKEDAIVLKILEAIKTNSKLSVKQEKGPYFFLTLNVLSKLYTDEEIENSYIIQKECQNFNFLKKRGELVSFPYKNKRQELYNHCQNKLIAIKKEQDEQYLSRLNYELDIIEKMGYLDYFFIVEDYVKEAKKRNIMVGPGRGSAAGSLIAYLLEITEVDPLKYDLLFERFLNPERTSMPDIDVDFADYRRDEVCQYIQNRYGKEKFCYIITFQTYKVRGALQDLQRVYNIDSRDIRNIIDSLEGNDSFSEAYHNSESFRLLLKDEYYKELIHLASKLEGLPRQSSLHAAGIIINNTPLSQSLPTIESEGNLVSQFEAPILEELGYLKMDILGLTNLTIIEDQLKYIKANYNQNFSLEKIPFSDKNTFSILNNGLTCGVFQLESTGITKALKLVKVDSFDDITAVLALYRPGPMDNIPSYAYNKQHPEKITYLNEDLKQILSPTFNIIIYQEQIMLIARKIASFSLGKADLFRRAISKKNNALLSSLREEFIKGAISNHLTQNEAENIYDLIYKFASYGFNKSHSVSYAFISYIMSYIKANYPSCYYAGLLNHLTLNDRRIDSLEEELNYFSLELALPDVRKSKTYFVIDDKKLIIPFTLIKGINKNQIAALLKIQGEDISSFHLFIKASVKHHLSEENIVTLINAGALDCYQYNRVTLRRGLSRMLNYYQNIVLDGLISEEELSSFLPKMEIYPEDKELKYSLEISTLNILLSGSMMEQYQDRLREENILPLKKQLEMIDNNERKIAGIVKNVRNFKTKRGEEMGVALIEDDDKSINGVLFPAAYKKLIGLINHARAFIFTGRFAKRDDNIEFIIEDGESLED